MVSWFRLFRVTCCALMVSAFTSCGGPAPILLYTGTGVSPNDVAAIENILDNQHLYYSVASVTELNAMSPLQFLRYRLLIIPGGDFMSMGKSLKKGTADNIRQAVKHGLNYLGICAGAFLASSSTYYNGFNLTSGVTFGFYAAESQGLRKAAVVVISPGSPALEQYWEDGPQLSGWGAVIAQYPDRTPAVAEGKCGSGFVLLAGIHAEAPADWRRGMVFNTAVSDDQAYAVKLIRAALNGTSLPHY